MIESTEYLMSRSELILNLELLQEIGGNIHHCERVGNELWNPRAFLERKKLQNQANEIKKKIINIFNEIENNNKI